MPARLALKLGRLRKTLLTLLVGKPGGAPPPVGAPPKSGSGLITSVDYDADMARRIDAAERKRRREFERLAHPVPLAKARRRMTGSSRAEQLVGIRDRERRLLPVVRHTLHRVRAVLTRRELHHAWATGGATPHAGLLLAVRRVWEDARPALLDALIGPLRKQTTPDELAARQIGDLITGLAERGDLAIRAQLEALSALMDEGPREAVLNAIAEAAGLTPRQVELVARYAGQRLADGWTEAQVDRAAAAYAGQLLEQRAALIARTEAVRYTTALVLERGRDVGGVVVKQWVSARDEDVDAICRILDTGDAIPIDEPFQALGLSFDGPPAHPGCRCVPEMWRTDL
jgi:hypothetical protein